MKKAILCGLLLSIILFGTLSCGINNPPPTTNTAPYCVTYNEKDYAAVSYHILDNGAIVLEEYYTFSGIRDGWKHYTKPITIQGSYTIKERN